MNKRTAWLVLAIMFAAAMMMLGGCVQPEADGKLEDGGRVIALSGDFSQVRAYRGETVTLIYSGDGDVSLSVPDFEAEASGSGEVRVQFKAAKTGSFDIAVTADGGTQTGRLIVEELAETNVYNSVDAQEFEAAMTGDYLLLDVRTQEEYDNGHIEGALLIPHNELSNRLDEVQGADKVLVYCASGNRSVTASQILTEAGIKEVFNLQGGFSAWQTYKGVN